VSFTKVAEYQLRGLIHFHAVVRLDAVPPDDPDAINPPPNGFTAELLAHAIRLAAHGGTIDGHPVPAATAPVPVFGSHGERRAAWGKELDLRAIGQHQAGPMTAEQVAGYIAKYATKGTESFGPALDRRIRNPRQLTRVEHDLNPHIASLVRACWQLGAEPTLAPLRLRAWAHMLGFGGHWTTKSRRYSTTMGALRQARATWTTRQHGHDPLGVDQDQDDVETVVVLREWPIGAPATRPPARPPWPPPSPATPASSAAPLGLPALSPEAPSRSRSCCVDSLLTVDQAAEAMGPSARFIRRLIAERRITYTKLGRHVRIAESDLINYVTAGRIEPASRWQVGA
jgi:excisionase family DNA binding protein